jgi:hypothetical protein
MSIDINAFLIRNAEIIKVGHEWIVNPSERDKFTAAELELEKREKEKRKNDIVSINR